MITKKIKIILFLIIIMNISCAYNGKLQPGIYQPPQSSGTKIPLSVAIDKSGIKILPVNINAPFGITFHYETSETVFDSTSRIMSQLFDKVGDASKTTDSDFIVVPSFSTRLINSNVHVPGGVYTFDTNLCISFYDVKNDRPYKDYCNNQRLEMALATPGATALALLTDLSLFTLSPITVPAVNQLSGNKGLELLQENVDRSFDIITDKIKHDKKSILLASNKNNIASIDSSQNPQKINPKEVIPQSIYEDLMKCVVIIKTNEGMGSGFFISKDGMIVTNAHVVGYDSRVSVLTKDQKALLGTVVAVDVNRDLALVSVMGDDHPSLALGDIGKDGKAGNDVIAIGIPEGLSWSISKGIISAVRDVEGILIVQTDTAINRGNSGGPLISFNSGRVIGINSFGFRKDIATGLNFAISVSELRKAFPTYVK